MSLEATNIALLQLSDEYGDDTMIPVYDYDQRANTWVRAADSQSPTLGIAFGTLARAGSAWVQTFWRRYERWSDRRD